MVDISGRWALVTGSSRGVGLRVAKALAEKGCKIILHSRKRSSTDKLAAELTAKGTTVHQVAAELSSPHDIAALILDVKKITNDNLDILYNNAAIQTPYVKIFTVPAEDYALSFQVNTIAPAKLCDAFIPGMLERNWGRVVNVTSGIADQPEMMAYSCSKAALDRYVRDILPTLNGTDVLINLMDPGWLRTDMGGPDAPNNPDSVLPGALVPVLLEKKEGSGKTFHAQDYVEK